MNNKGQEKGFIAAAACFLCCCDTFRLDVWSQRVYLMSCHHPSVYVQHHTSVEVWGSVRSCNLEQSFLWGETGNSRSVDSPVSRSCSGSSKARLYLSRHTPGDWGLFPLGICTLSKQVWLLKRWIVWLLPWPGSVDRTKSISVVPSMDPIWFCWQKVPNGSNTGKITSKNVCLDVQNH